MDSAAYNFEILCGRQSQCSLAQTIDELIDEFDALDDWEERYEFLIEMGEDLAPIPAEWKTDANRVEGCLSNVWMVAQTTDDDPPIIRILAESDSLIVSGLVAILLRIYSGRPPREILDCDIHCVFERLELSKHLSSSRRNGLHAMIERIRTLAKEALEQPSAK